MKKQLMLITIVVVHLYSGQQQILNNIEFEGDYYSRTRSIFEIKKSTKIFQTSIKGNGIIIKIYNKGSRYSSLRFKQLKTESNILNRLIARSAEAYLIVYNNDILITVRPPSPLGKTPWTQFSSFSIYSKDEDKIDLIKLDNIELFLSSISQKMIQEDLVQK